MQVSRLGAGKGGWVLPPAIGRVPSGVGLVVTTIWKRTMIVNPDAEPEARMETCGDISPEYKPLLGQISGDDPDARQVAADQLTHTLATRNPADDSSDHLMPLAIRLADAHSPGSPVIAPLRYVLFRLGTLPVAIATNPQTRWLQDRAQTWVDRFSISPRFSEDDGQIEFGARLLLSQAGVLDEKGLPADRIVTAAHEEFRRMRLHLWEQIRGDQLESTTLKTTMRTYRKTLPYWAALKGPLIDWPEFAFLGAVSTECRAYKSMRWASILQVIEEGTALPHRCPPDQYIYWPWAAYGVIEVVSRPLLATTSPKERTWAVDILKARIPPITSQHVKNRLRTLCLQIAKTGDNSNAARVQWIADGLESYIP